MRDGVSQSQDISAADFARASQLIHRLAGLHIPDSPKNRNLLKLRLTKLTRKRGFENLSAYIEVLLANPFVEAPDFVAALTTGVTSFFREPNHFTWLRRRGKTLLQQGRCVSLWSAACSTGQEAYSMAMTLADLDLAKTFHIFASDVDRHALDHAKAGIYSTSSLVNLGPSERAIFKKYSDPVDPEYIRMQEDLRRRTEFRTVNLHDESSWPEATFDVIFCRNVLIYFRSAEAVAILLALTQRLNLGGHLVLGHVEAGLPEFIGLRGIGHAIFQKTSDVRPHPLPKATARQRA